MDVERLRDVAGRLADACPADLGTEIAVTGSLGAGLADEHSDVELLFLCGDVPTVERVRDWLAAVGATAVLTGDEASGVWAWCRVDGVEVEPVWGRTGGAERELDAILAGEALAHARLAFAHVLVHSEILRTGGLLPRLAGRLQRYPDELARRLIADALAGLEIPSPRLGGALRGDRFSLESRLLNGAERALRIVFALNRRWEPPRWKWLTHYASDLAVAPPRLAERVVAALLEPDAVAAARAVDELLREALALVPADVDVEAARRGTDARLAILAEVPVKR